MRGHRLAAVPQRVRGTLRKVWNRSHWGSAMTWRWRLLLRPLGGVSDAASTSQSERRL